MNWTLQGVAGGGEGRELKGQITLYTSEYSHPEKLSQAFGFFGYSDNSLSEVYLLAWKYWNLSIPTTITQSFSDLAKYHIYYDMPECYPTYHLVTKCYMEFTPEYMSKNLLPGWNIGELYAPVIPAGLNATYYLSPDIAYYWGEYHIVNPGYQLFKFAPEQRWYVHEGFPPRKGETGYIHLGNFNFGPYSPGLNIQVTRIGDNCTINLTGDIWANLTWPHFIYNYLAITEEGSWYGPVSPYPQLSPRYTLYVDGINFANGILGRYGRSDFHGWFWDNISLSWNTFGQKARLVLDLPSMATISQFSTYQIDFDLSRNCTIPPFFSKLSMPLNYSKEETIRIVPSFRDTISSATVSYSFDHGDTWKNAEVSPEGFDVPCEEKSQLAIKINASDLDGNRYFYYTNPAALCKEVKADILQVESTHVLIKFTDVEGKSLHNIAVLSNVDGNISYIQLDSKGQIYVNKSQCTESIITTFPCVGIYEEKTVTLQFEPIEGDVNRDGIVNIGDIVLIATAYGSSFGDSNWRPEADIAPPWNLIDILDLVTCTRDYGKTWKFTISVS